MSKDRVRSLINIVKIMNEKYEHLEKLTGEKFNIFSILGMESDEVRTHSNFIYELLDAHGSHGYGELFVQLFLDALPGIENYGKIIKVAHEYTTMDNRRIDFLIETEKYVIGIEMKIYAGDQKDQLLDYHKAIKKRCKDSDREPMLYYLTLFGSDASEESTGLSEEEEKYYLPLSFSYHMHNWIERCIEKTATKPVVRELLIQYLNLIKKLTNRISHNLEDEMKEVIKTPEDIEAAHTIYEEYLTIWAKKEAEFWLALYKKLKEIDSTDNKILDEFIIYADSSDEKDYYISSDNFTESSFSEKIAEIRKKDRYFGLTLHKKPKKIGDYIFCFEINELTRDKKISIIFSIRNDEDGCLELSPKAVKILKKCDFHRVRHEIACWTELSDISFAGVNSPEPTFNLFDTKEFDAHVSRTAKKALGYIEKVLERETEILKAL